MSMEPVSIVVVAAAVELSEFQQNLVVAFVGIIGGVLGTIAVERFKLRREPTKRLSWDAEIHNAMLSTDENLRRQLQLNFNGHPIAGLSSVDFRVENTGNRVVKDQYLRFDFPVGQLVEAAITSGPEREMGVVRCQDREQGPGEAVFAIGHLERGQAVSLRLSVSVRDLGNWRVVAHNDEGDVEFHERAAARRQADQEHVPTLFALTFLLFSAPPLAALLGDLGRIIAVVLGTALLLSIVPHLAPAGRALRDFLTRPEPKPGVHINRVDSSTFSIGDHGSATHHAAVPGQHT
ncbi:hypothetical protein [Streptomyces longhuiensis]|uniref:hypothetical protein n=1 Tax=Streptomyces longhuiensis TaxID=2880933 RepID=UPI001D0B714C|nr:hypothetical protein [Streptomyces longhuiensis]UDM05518.1 hypothetical protein LGI35_45560 [Streptomyces longhuiensis]